MPLRCRCSLLAEVALVALVICLASAAGAQVSAGGDAPKGGASLDAALSAAAEVPGPGDPDLSGTADVSVSPRRGRVCFDIDLDVATPGADTVVAVHIHPGTAGTVCAGEDCPAAIDLDFANQGLEGCVKRVGTQLLNSIVDQPEQFYLHVHTARFPAGAVRGQLEK